MNLCTEIPGVSLPRLCISAVQLEPVLCWACSQQIRAASCGDGAAALAHRGESTPWAQLEGPEAKEPDNRHKNKINLYFKTLQAAQGLLNLWRVNTAREKQEKEMGCVWGEAL